MLKEITKNKLTLKVLENEKLFRLVWNGKSTDREPGEYLTPFFNDLLTEVQKLNVSLECDFSSLDYMNSSTITPFIQFLDKAKNNDIVVKVLYSKEKAWQEVSFSAMKFFETKNSKITIQGI